MASVHNDKSNNLDNESEPNMALADPPQNTATPFFPHVTPPPPPPRPFVPLSLPYTQSRRPLLVVFVCSLLVLFVVVLVIATVVATGNGGGVSTESEAASAPTMRSGTIQTLAPSAAKSTSSPTTTTTTPIKTPTMTTTPINTPTTTPINTPTTTTTTINTPTTTTTTLPSVFPSVGLAPSQPMEAILHRTTIQGSQGGEVFPIAFHPLHRRFLASGGCPIGATRSAPTIVIWDLYPNSSDKVAAAVANFTTHEQPAGVACVLSIAFDFKGRFLATGGRDNATLVWNMSHFTTVPENNPDKFPPSPVTLQDEEPFLQFKGHFGWVWSVAWHPKNDMLLASASRDGSVHLWSAYSGNKVVRLDNGGSGGGAQVNSVSFHPNGTCLAWGDDNNEIRIWTLETWPPENVAVLQGHEHWVFLVRYSPQGNLLASLSFDATMALWDASSGQLLFQSSSLDTTLISYLAWSPSGQYLATASVDRTVHIWKVVVIVAAAEAAAAAEANKPAVELIPVWFWQNLNSVVVSVAWSADESYLAWGGMDGTIQIWEII